MVASKTWTSPRLMGKRTGGVHNITVVVPRHGTPAAPKPLIKAVTAEVKKSNRVFQNQDPVSASDLQGLEDASNWNGLLLNARGERGPQWDVTTQMYHVQIGTEEYFDPTLLEDPPKTPPPEQLSLQTNVQPLPAQMTPAHDTAMAIDASPTRGYPPQGIPGGIPMNRPMVHGGYPQYGQPLNGVGHHAPMGQPMANPGGYPMHPQPISQPGMMPGMMPQYPGMQQHTPIGGLSYNPAMQPNPAMGQPGMGMPGYGHPPPQPGYNPNQFARGPPGGAAPMSGAYGGMY